MSDLLQLEKRKMLDNPIVKGESSILSVICFSCMHGLIQKYF